MAFIAEHSSFGRRSDHSAVAKGVICGFGAESYLLAIDALAGLATSTAAGATHG